MPASEQLDRIVRVRVERARAEAVHSLASIDLGNPSAAEKDIVRLINRLKTKVLLSPGGAIHTIGEIEHLAQFDLVEAVRQTTYGLEKAPTTSQISPISARNQIDPARGNVRV